MVTKTNVIEKNSRLKADELKSPWNRALTRNAEWPDKVKRGFKISFLSCTYIAKERQFYHNT